VLRNENILVRGSAIVTFHQQKEQRILFSHETLAI